ncbi:MAG: hypothetical protein RL272_635 [Candidatus Parcubacteria bacterium]|jgi:hypothetical protein
MPTATETGAAERNAATQAMMQRVVSAVGPVAERVIDGEFRLLPAADVAFDEVRTAVFMAAGAYIREVAFVNRAAYDACCPKAGFSRTLEQGVEALHGFRLLTLLGSRRWQQHRRHFGYDAAIPLEAYLAGTQDRLPRQNLRAALFFFWGYALAHHDRGLERLLPLVELLPRAIPLGEIAGRPGAWAVLVA